MGAEIFSDFRKDTVPPPGEDLELLVASNGRLRVEFVERGEIPRGFLERLVGWRRPVVEEEKNDPFLLFFDEAVCEDSISRDIVGLLDE